jgi:DNA polymerase-3 subunit gamma/tau
LSYLVLARKSRPQTFAEVVGQKAVVRTLQNALSQNRVPHGLIFSGVRGTGKTTLARIMAKALNCEQGPAAEPCNTCRSCRDITNGTSIDLQEVDGASNRGIQEIRELKEKIRFMPNSSRYKIIIIDEVHMLTTEAFNALLKTLEEPPDHVYFMFATTELHKIPVTILSRCQRYELKRLAHKELATHFNKLAMEEGVQVAPEALDMIVREAGGSVRDGLSLLDQIFSYCGTEVKTEEVVDVLGLVSHQLVANLGVALLNGDLAAVYTLLDEMYLHGTDIKRFSNDLLTWFRGLVVCKVSKKPGDLLEVTEDELALLETTAAGPSLETLSAMFNLLLEGLEKASFSQQPRLALELTFIRAVQFRDVVPVSDLISRFDQMLAGTPLDTLPAAPPIETRSLQQNRVEPSAQTSPSPSVQIPVESPRNPVAVDQPVPPSSRQPALSEPAPSVQPHPPGFQDKPKYNVSPEQDPAREEAPHPVEEKTTTSSAADITPAPPLDAKKKIRRNWDAFLKYVRERQPWIAAALQMAASVERKGDDLIIHFDDSADCTLLKQKEYVNSLTEYALDFFQENLKIQFEVPGSNACSIDPTNGLAPQQERRALAHDPLVLTALDVFTGQVGDIRIGPRYRTSSKKSVEEPTEEGQPAVEE